MDIQILLVWRYLQTLCARGTYVFLDAMACLKKSITNFLRIGDVVFQKWWKITDLSVVPEAIPVTEEPKPPKVQDYYITDEMNNRIEKAKIGDTIYLNIKTSGMIGESMSINLDDKSADFKYNGEVLVDDTLSDYQITKNLEKIALEVVKQQ